MNSEILILREPMKLAALPNAVMPWRGLSPLLFEALAPLARGLGETEVSLPLVRPPASNGFMLRSNGKRSERSETVAPEQVSVKTSRLDAHVRWFAAELARTDDICARDIIVSEKHLQLVVVSAQDGARHLLVTVHAHGNWLLPI